MTFGLPSGRAPQPDARDLGDEHVGSVGRSRAENLEELHSLLRPAMWGTPEHYPVSMDVGKVDNGQYLLELNRE